MKKKFTEPIKAAAAAVKKCAFLFAFSFAFFPTFIDVHGQSVLLADIAQSEELTYNEYSSLTGAAARVYFLGNNDTELWTISTSAGNNESPKLLRTFVSASKLTVVGPRLYFVADDGVSGSELWKSDGTIAGTVRVKEIKPGSNGSDPDALTNVKGTLYFSARNGINGKELWKSNGSPGGTVLVKDILPKTGSGNPTSLTSVNGILYFAANDGINGIELWRSDGTASGTVMVRDIKPGAGVHSAPNNLVNVYGMLFFVASDATGGRELWKSDGTAEGTVRVKDIRPGTSPSRIANTTAVYRTLFFSATDGIHGEELWKSDGTEPGTVMVKDMTPGPGGNQDDPEVFLKYPIANFTNIAGTLFFTGHENDIYYIWKSNGTAQGTMPITHVAGPGIAPPKPRFTLMNNRIYYFNESGSDVHGFWSMDRNAKDHQHIMDFWQEDYYSYYYPGLARVDNMFFFFGRPDASYGFKLIKYDGTAQGTTWWDISTTSIGSDPVQFTHYNGKLFLRAMPSSRNHELWVTDGTPAGTRLFFSYDEHADHLTLVGNYLYASEGGFFRLYRTDLLTGKTERLLEDRDKPPISFMTTFNGTLLFALGGRELWRTDGTHSGTVKLMDSYQIHGMHILNGELLVRVYREDFSDELWSTNGTLSGTVKVKTFHSGPAPSSTYRPSATIGNTLYLVANDGIHGNEVWKTDGTAAGTLMIADLHSNDADGWWNQDIRSFAVFRDTLYISGMDDNGEWALFKTNGKNPGVSKVLNIDQIGNMMVLGDQLLLFTIDHAARAGSKKTSVWTTDGTAAKTELVRELDFAPNNANFSHQIANDVVYFTTMKGGPLWRTDGTTCGTFVPDIGSLGAFPIDTLNSHLIFGSYDVQAGYEPHAFNLAEAPGNPCGDAMATQMLSLQGSEERILTGYPNPFYNDFALRVEGKDDETAELRAFTLYGRPVEDIGEVKANTDHRVGQAWRPGLYVVQVLRRGVVSRYMVIKE